MKKHRIVMIRTETAFGDPCHSTVDAFVSELAAGPGKTVQDDKYGVADELTKKSKFTFGSNFGEGKALTMSTAKM
ncbi:hypothetical protein bas03_0068 [Escherichia phage JulesPiccard]|uniref:Uncharacterized protein n=1 Tax=Escherichia phage JulesPiccard TaxID=2851956 RepID=A0AAE8B2T2_9CAUD|nr:hypothetical protein bas03_0068 [Escherichia phage JulesPiccard]